MILCAFQPSLLISALAAGIVPDTKQDEQQELSQDHQTAIKQSLAFFYKTNLYPALKAEIQTELMKPESHSPPFMSE